MSLFSRLHRSHRVAVGVVVAVIALGAAMGAFASQDGLRGAWHGDSSQAGVQAVQDPTDTPQPTATGEATATAEATSTPEATPTPEATETPEPTPTSEATGAPEASDTPEPTATPGSTETPEATPTVEGGRRDVVGIPDDNPSHQPDDGDGVCEKGETVVKTTPSGNLVTVPCHSVEPGPPSFSHGHQSGNANSAGD
jgi:hypothetical protein